jgi:hypothetical protein
MKNRTEYNPHVRPKRAARRKPAVIEARRQPAGSLSSHPWSSHLTVSRLVPALALLLLTGPAFAQGTAPIPKSFLNKGTVHLPIQINEAERPQIREIQLYVKEGPQAPWILKEKVSATQTFFTYRAPQDGEYWFNVATVDRTGRSIPANIAQEPPGLIVVIDSAPPQVEAHLVGSTPDGQQIRCEVRDANPEPAKTRLFFQTRDQVWRHAGAVVGQPDLFNVPAQAALTGMIRVIACDLAGNTTTREFNLAALKADNNNAQINNAPARGQKSLANVIVVDNPTEKVFVTPPPADEVAPKTPGQAVVISETVVPYQERVEVIAQKPGPQAPPLPVAVEQASTAPFALPSGSEARSAGDKMPTAAAKNAQPEVPMKRHFVNNTHLFLEYQIEKAGVTGVGRVEIWYTRDAGQTWQKLGEDANRKGLAEVELPGEGVYGVSMAVANGRGFGAVPPSSGDQPDWWIEVDTTRPQAELVNVRFNPSGDDASLHITWTAKDKNLHPEPIDLFYAVNRQGPWLPIAKGLKNDGRYRWIPGPDIGSHAYVRLTVRDQAGNTASSESVQSVALDDLSRPRGRLVGITTAPRTAPQVVGNGIVPLPPQGN